MSRNVFIEANVLCPVCKNPIILKYPNPKLYAAAQRDADRRVTAYTWSQGIETDVVPHYYAVLQCSQCCFADFKEEFENPVKSAKDRLVYQARNNLDLKRVLLLKKLRRIVPEGTLTLDAAIAIHLAAIYNILLPAAEENIDHNKLGRLFLRLSWLYREQKGEPGPTEEDGEEKSTSPVLEKLFETVESLQHGMGELTEDLGAVRRLIRERASELGMPQEGEENPYWQMVASIHAKMNELQTLLEMFQQSVITDKKGKLAAIAFSATNINNQSEQIFNTLATQWIEMPRNEETCIKRAVNAFDFSYKHEDSDLSAEQSLAVVNLIVKLLLKLGNLNGALDYASQIFKSGFRDKQELQRRLSQGKHDNKISAVDEKNIQRKIGTINNTLAHAGETRRHIIELIFEKQKDKILPILKENVEKSALEQREALLSAGFVEDLIPFLTEKGLLKQEETKKGWFSKKN